MSFLPSEHSQKQLPPGTVEPVFCWTCGKPYHGKLATDRRVHKLHHRRALTARAALAGPGPLAFPVTRAEWKNLEDPQFRCVDDPVESALRDWWWHFAQSLATVGYNLKRHCSWQTYVRIQLSDENHWFWHGRDVMRTLIAQFGEPIWYWRPVSELRRCKCRRARR
jgi:hypothetical protein